MPFRRALPFLLLAACASPAGAPARGDRLVNLYDAFGPKIPGTTPDWGFSCLVEYRDLRILFDSGTNADILAQNARALGVDLSTIDFAVGSHAHADHVSGFDYLLKVNPRVRIYLPSDFALGAPILFPFAAPDPAAARSLPPEERYFGSAEEKPFRVASSGRFWGANAEYVAAHREVAPGVTLIATSSELLGYFSKYPPHQAAPRLSGLPELSLSLRTRDGEVLVVGCSHSSVDVIVRAAKDHLKREIDLVMGGFHLVPYGADEVARTAKVLRDELAVRRVAPAHCTGHQAFKTLREFYGERYLFAGLGSEIRLP